jgi:Na+-driven multidrug efflux pump
MGFANAALTLVGQKTGEEKHEQAINTGFRCLCFSLIICAIIAATYITFSKKILGIFTNDKSLIDLSAPFLMFVCITMFPKSINNVIGLGIRGLGDTKWMLYGQIFGTVLIITLSYLLIFVTNLGLWGIFVTLLIDESVRGIINLLRFWKGREIFFLKPFEKICLMN